MSLDIKIEYISLLQIAINYVSKATLANTTQVTLVE